MKKYRLLFTFSLLTSFFWVACGSEAPKTTEGEPTPKAAQENIEAVANLQDADVDSPKKEDEKAHIKSPSSVYFGDINATPVPQKEIQVEALKGGSVVLLVFDALNNSHLGAYGYERNTSPTIDAVAQKGLLLTNYISNSSWTRPSYTTIITGLPKKEHGVELRGGWMLEPHITTLAERFRKAGYRTAGFTGNPLVRKSWGFDQGYQLYEGPTTRGLKAFPRDRIWVDAAIKWLNQVKDKPFFLTIFMTSSHPPYRPPAEPRTFLSQVPEGEIIEHPYKEYREPLPKDAHDRIVAAYDDEIAYMDGQVKRLLDHLKTIEREGDTIIAMTADHGEMFGQHNCYLHAYHMWEQTLRVPFILSAPNLKLSNVYDDRPFTHEDVAPTLLDLVGIAHDDDALKGISLVDALGDPSLNQQRVLFSQYNAHGVRRQSIRDGRWKMVHHHKVDERAAKDLDELHPSVKQANPKDLPSLAWDGERWEIYDLLEDPDENNNLVEDPKAKDPLNNLTKELGKHVEEIAPEDTKALPDEVLQALKNAGYIR